jgi:hypothetical protein
MNAWMTPPLEAFGDAAGSQDTVKIRINAVLLRAYIDQNLPEMRQLAAGATTKKSAAQEYIAFLEDVRTGSDLWIQAIDKINSGDIDGGTDLVFEGNTYLEKAQAHILRVNALRK